MRKGFPSSWRFLKGLRCLFRLKQYLIQTVNPSGKFFNQGDGKILCLWKAFSGSASENVITVGILIWVRHDMCIQVKIHVFPLPTFAGKRKGLKSLSEHNMLENHFLTAIYAHNRQHISSSIKNAQHCMF